MEDKNKAIQELFTRLEQLGRQQKVFQAEIYKLTQGLHKLTSPDSPHESEVRVREPFMRKRRRNFQASETFLRRAKAITHRT
jgi:hypothetical protein